MKVENKNAHMERQDKHYFFATHVRDGDGTGDDVVMLLLTDKELERAAKRATKNKRKICRSILQSFKVAMKKKRFFLMTPMLQSQRSRAAS